MDIQIAVNHDHDVAIEVSDDGESKTYVAFSDGPTIDGRQVQYSLTEGDGHRLYDKSFRHIRTVNTSGWDPHDFLITEDDTLLKPAARPAVEPWSDSASASWAPGSDTNDARTRVRRPAMIMVMLALLIAAKADDWLMTVELNEGTGQMNT